MHNISSSICYAMHNKKNNIMNKNATKLAIEYYKNNLDKLGKLQFNESIQIICHGKKTNYFALNNESKKVLIEFINNIK